MCHTSPIQMSSKEDLFERVKLVLQDGEWKHAVSLLQANLRVEWTSYDHSLSLLRYIDEIYFINATNTVHYLLFDLIECLKEKQLLTSEDWDSIMWFNLSWMFVDWLSQTLFIEMNHCTLEYILYYSESDFQSPSNKYDMIDIHPRSLFTIKLIQMVIPFRDVDLLRTVLARRFAFSDTDYSTKDIIEEAQAKYNTEKFLCTFSSIYTYEVTRTYSHKEKKILYDLLFLLFHYFIYLPYRPSSHLELYSIEEKKRIAVNYMFLTCDPDLAEYAVQYVISYKQEGDYVEPKHLEWLVWKCYPNDVSIYRNADIYEISSSNRHRYLGYQLMYYEGEDPDLIAIRSQYYKETQHRHIRKMSIFELE